ncbi:hypothetical protein GGTG_12303 [Gaeumannomyces tritici R3-111a-1]|uniref:Rhodopsin domain-containing protein n=1 Tax=Gaeumannomyces tritici (strain R3-111a-1) TaxID=644352 RepID=J3PFM8_GAET3|nr:hypothetical protein GGTG_12303 [Gaeumannomyces tritici R3-111a-1]EJT70130.1 hypothetical protein GGTG_12303 [Gaeumannomyces tritici R3-111a-1]
MDVSSGYDYQGRQDAFFIVSCGLAALAGERHTTFSPSGYVHRGLPPMHRPIHPNQNAWTGRLFSHRSYGGDIWLYGRNCQPMEKIWDVTGTVQGTCINNSAFFYAAPGFHILTDIWILLLPMHTLKNIRRPNREKAALFAIFGVGAFAVAASCIRLHTILLYNLSDDKFRDALPVNLWTMIETTVAVICASVPGLKPIFSRWRRHGGRETNSQNMGASKLPELLRRREERKQQHTDVTLDGLPGEEMRPTPAAEVSVMQPRGAVPAATLGGDGGGGWDGGDGSGPSAVRYSGISNAGSHLTSPSLHQGRYSSQECIMREPAPVDRAEAGDPPSWPLGPANNV